MHLIFSSLNLMGQLLCRLASDVLSRGLEWLQLISNPEGLKAQLHAKLDLIALSKQAQVQLNQS